MMMGLQLSIWTTQITSEAPFQEGVYVDDQGNPYVDNLNNPYIPGPGDEE